MKEWKEPQIYTLGVQSTLDPEKHHPHCNNPSPHNPGPDCQVHKEGCTIAPGFHWGTECKVGPGDYIPGTSM